MTPSTRPDVSQKLPRSLALFVTSVMGLLATQECVRPALALGEPLTSVPVPAAVQADERQGSLLIEEHDERVSWSGAWSSKELASVSGGRARLSMEAGSRATFTFKGDSVTWIGYRDEWSGRARVFIDGALHSTVDTFASPAQPRANVMTVSGLSPGTHTLTIEAMGAHGSASRGSWVWVDGFRAMAAEQGVRSPRGRNRQLPQKAAPPSSQIREENTARIEQDDPAVKFQGAWSKNALPSHSGGSASLSMEPGTEVSVVFTGTGIRWIGYEDEWSGIAEVFLDGRLQGVVDTYAKPSASQAVIFRIDGLENREHTLSVRPTGKRHASSAGSWVWVDAFVVTR